MRGVGGARDAKTERAEGNEGRGRCTAPGGVFRVPGAKWRARRRNGRRNSEKRGVGGAPSEEVKWTPLVEAKRRDTTEEKERARGSKGEGATAAMLERCR